MKNKRLIWFLLLSAGLIFILFTANWAANNNSDKELSSTKPENKKVTNVEILELKPVSFVEFTEFIGRARPYKTVNLSTEEGGLIESLPVEKGDLVKKDQLIAKINVRYLETVLEQAKSDLTLKEDAYKKAQALYEKQGVTEHQKLTAEVNFQIAQQQLEQAKIRLAKAHVYSPITGVVCDKYVEAGEIAAPAAPIVSVVDYSQIKVETQLTELDLNFVHLVTKASITFDALPEQTFNGKFVFIRPDADSSQTYPSEILVANPNYEIIPGMMGRIKLVRKAYENVLTLPQAAVLDKENVPMVFKLNSNNAKEIPVKIEYISKNRVVVWEGLEPGDKVIVVGNRELVDGDEVKVLKTITEPQD